MREYPIAYMKAILLEGGTVTLSSQLKEKYPSYFDNHHHNPQIFLSLSPTSRVRLTVTDIHPEFYLGLDDNNIPTIYNNLTKEKVSTVGFIEAVIHAPDQLFLGLYEYCKEGCRFCPLSKSKEKIHYSLDSIFEDIEKSSKISNIQV